MLSDISSKFTNKEKEVFNKLSEKIHSIYPEIKIVLFGSRANQKFKEDSDYDLCIITTQKKDKLLQNQIFDIVWEIGFENDMILSSVILSDDDIQLSKSRFIDSLKEEGIYI